MAFGDLLTSAGRIEWQGVVFDAKNGTGDGIVNEKGIQGLLEPERDTPQRVKVVGGHGQFAGRDLYTVRKIVLPNVQIPTVEGLRKVTAAMAPRSPSDEAEIGWRGFGWPVERWFRAIARPVQSDDTWDKAAGVADWHMPNLAWETFDPFGYEGVQSSAGPVAAGSSAVVSSAGTWETTRVRVTFTGPLVEPGISTTAVTGAAIRFAGLTLPDGETISLHFHRWTERFPTSSYFSPTQLGQAMFGGGPPASYAEPVWFPLVPGSQTLTHHGAGGGSMEVVWFDAHATPPVI